MANLPVTALYCGLHTIVYAVLSFRVAIGRSSFMKEGKDPEQNNLWKRKSAAQASFAQYYAPIFFVLCILEANGIMSTPYLYAMGGAITAARLSHVLQLSFPDHLIIYFRMFGFLSTCAFFLVGGALVFLIGLQETSVLPENFLGNHRTWLGFANDKANVATDQLKSGFNTAKQSVKSEF